MSTSFNYSDDSRFGAVFKSPASSTVTNGSASLNMTYFEDVTLTDPDDPFSFSTLGLNISQNSKTTQFLYTASTRTLTETSPAGRVKTSILNLKGDITSVQFASFTPITFTYNNHGQVSNISHGVSRSTDLNHSSTTGFLTSVLNPLGQTTSYAYDLSGRLVSQTLQDARVILYSYDTNGNLVRITPPGKPAHEMDYNGFDLIGSYLPPTVSAPSTVSTTYYYNDDRELIQITRPDGESLQRNFNTITGNLDSEILPTGVRSYSYYNGKLTDSTSEDFLRELLESKELKLSQI